MEKRVREEEILQCHRYSCGSGEERRGVRQGWRGQQLTGLVGAAHRDVLTRRDQQPGHLSQGAGLLSAQVLQTRHQCSDVAFKP